MKIWVLTNEYNDNIIGGLGTVATHLSHALARQENNHVTVICIGTGHSVKLSSNKTNSLRAIHFPPNSIYRSPRTMNFNKLPISNWIQTKGYEQPDLIHVHSLQGDELAQFYKRKYRVPLVYTCHSMAIQSSGKVDSRQINLLRNSDYVTTPSVWQKAQIIHYCPWVKDKVRVIHNGVHMPLTHPDFKQNSHRLLFVGRLLTSKGVTELIQALSLLKVNKPNIQLDIVGTGSAKYITMLKQKAALLNIKANINWLGKLDPAKVQKLYSSYGCVVVPSYRESFGLVALEAMAAGIPLVSTRSGGLGSFVNNRNATIIPHIIPNVIAQSIRKVWSSPSLTNTKVFQARKTASRHHWKKIAKTYNELFVLAIHRKGSQQ